MRVRELSSRSCELEVAQETVLSKHSYALEGQEMAPLNHSRAFGAQGTVPLSHSHAFEEESAACRPLRGRSGTYCPSSLEISPNQA